MKCTSEGIKDLNVKAKDVKLLEENTGVNLRFGNRFLDTKSIGTK